MIRILITATLLTCSQQPQLDASRPDAVAPAAAFMISGQSNAQLTNLATVESQISPPFVLERVAQGGTGFATGHWVPASLGGPGSLAREALDLLRNGQNWRAVVWNQWEADAADVAAASAYRRNLEALIVEMRASARADLVVFLVGAHASSSRAHADKIRAAQDEIAARDPLIHIIDLDDVPFPEEYDGVHYLPGHHGSGVDVMSKRTGQALESARD